MTDVFTRHFSKLMRKNTMQSKQPKHRLLTNRMCQRITENVKFNFTSLLLCLSGCNTKKELEDPNKSTRLASLTFISRRYFRSDELHKKKPKFFVIWSTIIDSATLCYLSFVGIIRFVYALDGLQNHFVRYILAIRIGFLVLFAGRWFVIVFLAGCTGTMSVKCVVILALTFPL